MKRFWLPILLLLSVGVNLGLASSIVLRRVGSPPLAADLAERPTANFEQLADRLELEGEARRRFVELHRELFRQLRRALPRLQAVRRELYRELLADQPDRARLEELLRRLARANVGIERGLIQVTLATRELLDGEQERRYLRFLERRLRPVREALAPGARLPVSTSPAASSDKEGPREAGSSE